MLNYDRTVISVNFWLIKAFIRTFYLRKKWQTSVSLFFFFVQFSDMLRFCVISLNVMLCHFIPKGSSTNTYHRHSFTLLWVQRVRVSVDVGARFMLRLWLSSRLMLAFGLHTVVPSESETLRLMLNCDRTWFWWVSGWLKYVAESANVESAGLIFIYIYFLNQLLSISLKELKMSKVVPTLTESLAERRQDLNPATAADLSVTFISATWEVSCIFRYFLILAGRFLSFYNPVFHSLVGTAHWRHKSQSSNRLPAVSVNVTTSPLPDNSTVGEAAMGRLGLTLADILPSH